MKINSFAVLLGLLLALSCTRVPTINLEEHSFNKSPDNIVFVQISNFGQDIFAELKHSQTLISSRIFTENFNCIGQMWRMNHTQINPSLDDSFFTQFTGFSRSENSCEKYKSETILSDQFIKFGFGAIFYERGDTSFVDDAISCNEDIFKNTVVFKSRAKHNSESLKFHAEKQGDYLKDNIYNDESCSTAECFSSLKDNFDHLWSSVRNYPRKIMTIRDSGNIKATKKMKEERVNQLTTFLEYLSNEFHAKNPTTLMVVTIAEENAPVTRLWASGPMSENFCGEFNELDLYNRFFWKSGKSEFILFKLQ